MSDTIQFQRAALIPVDPGSGKPVLDRQIKVHFNPESLKLTRQNNLQGDTKGGGTKSDASQHVDSSGAKLSLDLLFDTTLDFQAGQAGADVRKITQQLVDLYLTPPVAVNNQKPASAKALVFVWGTFSFAGLVESMSETLDFFSASGVPLRAAVNLSLVENRFKQKPDAGWPQPAPEPLHGAAGGPLSSAMKAGGVQAGLGGDWRGVALFNGLETPRFAAAGAVMGRAGLSVPGGASVGFSAGASADLGTALPGGFGTSVRAGFG